MSSQAAGLVGGCSGVAVYLIIIGVTLRKAWGRTRPGVLKRLRSPGATHSVRLRGGFGGTWNPTKPAGVRGRLFGPAYGTYRLDTDGRVHLDWHPKSGPEVDLVEAVAQSDATLPDARRAGGVRRVVACLYAVVIVAGFAVGFGLSSGTAVRRLGFGLLGVFAGLVVVWFVIVVGIVGWGTRSALRRKGTAG